MKVLLIAAWFVAGFCLGVGVMDSVSANRDASTVTVTVPAPCGASSVGPFTVDPNGEARGNTTPEVTTCTP
jgi:hypothetical protein